MRSERNKYEDNHIQEHHLLEHGAAAPEFIMRVEGTYKTALEAVRIRRRGELA